MNKLSLALNVVLLIAVGFLFFHVFSGDEPKAAAEKTEMKPDSATVFEEGQLRIAFVYGDSINSKYEFIKDAEVALAKDQRTFDERLRNKMKRAEDRYRELMEQAQTMTQQQMQEAQTELQQLDVDMQKYQEDLAMEYRKKEADLQKDYVNRIQTYLNEFNENHDFDYIVNYQVGGQVLLAKPAFDITAEVVEGLNEQYAEEQKETEEGK